MAIASARFPTVAGTLLTIGGAFAVAIATPGTSASRIIGVGIFVLLALWGALTPHHHLPLAVFMVYLGVVDGYVRMRSGVQATTLLHDVLLYGVALGALIRAASRSEFDRRLPPMTGWVLAYAAIVAIQLLNPNNVSTQHAFVALRPHLEWLPLFFLGYLTLRSTRRLRMFLLILLAIAAANGVVSTVQLQLTPEQFASWGPGYRDRIFGTATVARRVAYVESSAGITEARTRPFGLGPDFGFGGLVGLLAIPGAMALYAIRHGLQRAWILLPLTGSTILAVATSQARLAVVGTIVGAAAFLGFGFHLRYAIRLLLAAAATGAVALIAVSYVTGSASSGSFDRYKSVAPNSVFKTTFDYRQSTLSQIPRTAGDYPFGAGLGSVGPASGLDVTDSDSPLSGPKKAFNGESQLNFLIIELGIPGFLLVSLFQLAVLRRGIRTVRRIRDPDTRLLVLALVAPLAALIAAWVIAPTTVLTPLGPFFWTAAGAIAWWSAQAPSQRSGSSG